MNTRTFRAMNTEWWLGVTGSEAPDLASIEAAVHQAESRYSRFLHDSVLSRLNRERRVRDADLATLLQHALAMHETTGGAFDVRVGAALNDAGYDRTFEEVAAVTARAMAGELDFEEALRARVALLAGLDEGVDRKSTRLNSSHVALSRMPSSA